MAQKKIEEYLKKKKTSCDPEISSSDSESENETLYNKYLLPTGDLSYYNDILKRNSELKEKAKIICETGLSEVWKYFGVFI